MEFNVKLDRYEGPYTKLIDLIAERKLSITEISLVSVADDYIKHVQGLSEKNLVDISQFIVVASTLMLMKVKSLLPGVTYTEEEEKQVHDLEHKLELYQLLTSASVHVRKSYMKTPLHARKRSKLPGTTMFLPDARVTLVFLESIARLTLQSFKVPQALISIAVAQTLRIEDVITGLINRINTVQSMTLASLASAGETIEEKKKLLIVNFIALLELLKAGTVQVHQELEGGEIHISPASATS
jgi:segregation and condensation protein A